MTENATIDTPAPESQSFADYLVSENLKEKAPVDAPVESAPAAQAVSAVQEDTEPPVPAREPEPTESAVERNADGTFKKVNAKGEWKRNQELTSRLREAERERDALRAAKQGEGSAAPAAAPAPAPSSLDPTDPEPVIDRFLDRPDPYAALAIEAGKWAVREERRQAQQSAVRNEIESRLSAFVADHPDYHEKVAALGDVIFPNVVLEAIASDDLGPAVAYHLAQHPEEARRIAALRPLEGVKAIGTLVMRLTPAPVGSEVKAPVVSKAKPLIKPVSAAPIAPESPPPDDLPFGLEYMRRMNAQDRKNAEAMRGY